MQIKEAVETLISSLGGELALAREANDQIRIMNIANAYNAIYAVWNIEVDEFLAARNQKRRYSGEGLARYEFPSMQDETE